MEMDINQLNQLFNILNLSVSFTDKNVTFTDNLTKLPFKSYTLDGNINSDKKTLFSGWPFYLKSMNVVFEICIRCKGDNFFVEEIKRTLKKAPLIYDEFVFKGEYLAFIVEENSFKTCMKDGYECPGGTYTSKNSYCAREIRDLRSGGFVLHLNDKASEMWYHVNKETGEIKFDFPDYEDSKYLSLQDTIASIENSYLFTQSMKILFPKLSENYLNTKDAFYVR